MLSEERLATSDQKAQLDWWLGIRDWGCVWKACLDRRNRPVLKPVPGTLRCVTITGTTDLRKWRPKYPAARYILPSLSFSFAVLFRSLSAVCVAESGLRGVGSMRTRI
jgi:hypothetical protein